MSRLRIRERLARKRRALVVLACRSYCDQYSSLWFMYNLTFVYAMARLAIDDTPTDLARRDVSAFFSPQDCINFLRFSRSEVRSRHDFCIHREKNRRSPLCGRLADVCGYVAFAKTLMMCLYIYL